MINNNIKGNGLYAIKSIFIAKKCYIDVLKDDNSNVVDYHIWMKGVPSTSVIAKCVELNCTPLDIYQWLYDGEMIEFDLCVNKHNKPSSWLKWLWLFEYQTIEQFKWWIQFK